MKKNNLTKAMLALLLFAALTGYGQLKTTISINTNLGAITKNFTLTNFKTVNAPPMAVTITNQARFPSAVKTNFTTQTISGCKVTPVQYQVSSDKLGTFFISSGQEINIYPGAVYRSGEVASEHFAPYHLEYKRNPMDLTTDILAFQNPVTSKKAGAVQSNKMTINGNQFDFGTIDSTWHVLLGNSITGTTPGNVKKYLQVVESSQQLKTDFQSTSQVDVSTKIGVDVPDIPVSVGVDNKVSVNTSSSTISTVSSSKNTILLKYEQVFYTARATPKAGFSTLYDASVTAPLEDDLVYVKTVDYGMIYYIAITSTASKSDLLQAVKTTVSTNTNVNADFPIEGVPVGAEVGVGTTNTNMSSSTAQSILTTSTINVYQWGGLLLDDLNGNLTNIIGQLNTRNKFSKDNLGKPISYTLGFVKDLGGTAWINFDSKYASVSCSNATKYDVVITLTKLQCVKAEDWINDPDDEIYGEVRESYWAVRDRSTNLIKKSNGDNKYFWKKGVTQFETFTTGQKRDKNETVVLSGFDYDELMGLEIWLKAIFKDVEGDEAKESDDVTYQTCADCTADNGNRVYYMKNFKKEIDERFLSGKYDVTQGEVLDIGDDKYTQLSCYEKPNDTGCARMDAWLQFKVVQHQN